MATSRQPWSVPGVIVFSHGDLSYEVDLSHPLIEELAQSRLGERTVPAYERTGSKRLRKVIVRSLPPPPSDAHPLRSIVRKLLQRKPEDRYPSAAALEADLREGLAALGAPYGAPEALEEVLSSLTGASMKRGVLGPTSEGPLPPTMVTEADIITQRGETP
ncbi:MAG TPA: hypothetical protein VK539_37395 [Myxococcaceae bacterium]|nr:hypothetical protein [Myxococcaceae bacterium]